MNIKSIDILLLIFFIIQGINCKVKAQCPTKGTYEEKLSYQKFENPPVEYRSFPFYSINDSLDADEIKTQIHGFAQAGFGGFYLHSRDGLITEFLGKDWWTIMNAAVDAAQEAGIHSMFYDEDKWPSGYAGGIIPRMSEDYRAKALVRLKKETPLPTGSVILKENNEYKYIQHTAPMGNPIFNGTCWVDLFNPEMVAKFLEVSYHPYIEKFKPKITNYTFGIFADEPHIHARYFDRNTPNKGILSYSPWVAKRFREMYGYDFLDKVNLLFEEKDNWREVRLQYYRAVATQFDESFAKQISAYCEKNGIKFTGHYLGEDDLEKVRDRIGNSMMHYRWMQQPGMDILGLSTDNRLLTARSVSSVANQYGTPRRLSELFGISGQNMNFEDRKWMTGWHSILGINHFCPHLALYSMKGLRKRDYPPTFSYQQPYWPYNKKIEDYLGRIAYVASTGKYVPQLLVLNPLESEYIKGNNDGDFTSGVQRIMETLQAAHYDYDLGDEQILSEQARVVGHKLQVGDMTYRQVILPDMISLRSSTVKLLMDFHKAGGTIYSLGRFPQYLDGKASVQLTDLEKICIKTDTQQLAKTLEAKLSPQVKLSGKDAEKVWIQTRNCQDGNIVLFFNTSHTQAAEINVNSDLLKKNLLLWNPSLGKCFKLKPGANKSINLRLEPSELVWISSEKMNDQVPCDENYRLPKETNTCLTLENKWTGKRLAPNALTLDFASYISTNKQSFDETEPVIAIFNRLKEQQYNGKLILRFPVQVDQLPKTCKLVVEQASMYQSIKINEKPYTFKSDGFYVDHQFKSSSIDGLLQKGINTIDLELDFKAPVDTSSTATKRYGTEIESIYLTGDFGIEAKQVKDTESSQRNASGNLQIRPVHQATSFAITNEKTQVSGEISTDGYPFYAGAFELIQTFSMPAINPQSRYFLELPNCEAIVSVIELNGEVIDTLCWAPFRTDISHALKTGNNELKITIVNSLRNLLGPHHNKRGELIRVGPNSFAGAGGFPDSAGDANWYELRKTSKDLKTWTDTYNFIPFGLLEPAKITEQKN